MTSTLRILLGEHWPEPASAKWALLDGTGKPLRTGEGEPRSWPPAERVEAILHGPQTNWLKVRVPRANVREQAQALGFALEEQMVRETDSQHITPSLRGEETWDVIVVARERLKRLQAQFEAISRPLDGAFSVMQSLPADADAWVLAASGASLIVRSEAHGGWTEDLLPGDEAPVLLATAQQTAREAGKLPARLVLRGETRGLALAEWEKTLGLAIETGKPWTWYELATDANDLLHDEFQPRHRRNAWQKALRPALVALAVLMAAQLLFGTGYAWWRRAELSRLKGSMSQLMRSQLPNDPIQDPVIQLQRELNRQREQHGQLADDAALSLMADLAAALGSDAGDAIQSLKYRDNALELSLMPGKLDPASLRTRLETKGLVLSPREGEGKFTLRRNR